MVASESQIRVLLNFTQIAGKTVGKYGFISLAKNGEISNLGNVIPHTAFVYLTTYHNKISIINRHQHEIAISSRIVLAKGLFLYCSFRN